MKTKNPFEIQKGFLLNKETMIMADLKMLLSN
jgi:hypothetical protein